MTVKLEDFKDMLDYLSNKYDLSKEYIIRNAVYILYMCCDGSVSHIIDAEAILNRDQSIFKGFLPEDVFK